MFLIEATDNPRPVHKLCHQTQHPKQGHYLESPRARPEPLPAFMFQPTKAEETSQDTITGANDEQYLLSRSCSRYLRLIAKGKLLTRTDLDKLLQHVATKAAAAAAH